MEISFREGALFQIFFFFRIATELVRKTTLRALEIGEKVTVILIKFSFLLIQSKI